MISIRKTLKTALIPAFLLSLTACSAEDIAELLDLKIDANNAADVARSALDMTEVSDLAEKVTDIITGTGPDINEAINCADIPGVTNASGTATVTGTIGDNSENLTVSYTNCSMNGYTISGSLSVISATVGDLEAATVGGNLSVDSNGKTISIKNYSMVSDKDKVTGEYTNNFGMTLTLPLIGDILIDSTTPFTGNKLNEPDKPVTGVMTVTALNSGVELTGEGRLIGYSLALDSDGDSNYETPVLNNGSTLFNW